MGTESVMSQVDLKSYQAQLVKARDTIITDTDTDKFVIFGYSDSGASNSLMVEEYGEGGLEALVSEFNSGRYQYGLVGVSIKNKGTKYVLIIWQGEGTPILRKSACAHHAVDVTKFMNVTTSISARSEEELDPEAIKDELNKSSKY